MTFTAEQVADIYQQVDPDGISGKPNHDWLATAHRMALYNEYRENVRRYQNDHMYHGGRNASKYKVALEVMEAIFMARFGNVDLLRLAA